MGLETRLLLLGLELILLVVHGVCGIEISPPVKLQLSVVPSIMRGNPAKVAEQGWAGPESGVMVDFENWVVASIWVE